MTCIRCNHGAAKRYGSYGRKHIQRYRCRSCNATFSFRPARLPHHYTDPEKAAKILALMTEGMSIRAISRITGMHKNTIIGLMLTAAERCGALLNERIVNIPAKRVQCDEIWTFVQKKEKRTRTDEGFDVGDKWVFIALDADTKLIISHHVARRTPKNTAAFMGDLQSRLAGRVQLTTDGFGAYLAAVDAHFGT